MTDKSSVGQSVCCPWCHENVEIDAAGLLLKHWPGYMTGRECHASGLTLERAQDMTDEAIVRHVATGE